MQADPLPEAGLHQLCNRVGKSVAVDFQKPFEIELLIIPAHFLARLNHRINKLQ
jgi:hypothetical protein